ncbi:MAG: hypothetical protein JXQ90_01890 [Cyclobacteriaceae bacterium]
MIRLVLTLLFCSTMLLSHAQQLRDVVYLHNGSVIKGIIIEQVTNESIKIETADGSLFVFQMSEVQRIEREETPNLNQNTKFQAPEVMGKSIIGVDALGLLTYGPDLIGEFKLNETNTYLTTNLRLNSLGIAYLLLINVSADPDDYIRFDALNFSYGIGLKKYTLGANRWYYGGFLNHGHGGYLADPGYQWEWQSRFNYMMLGGYGGYVWRKSNGWNISAGFTFTLAVAYKDDWRYTNPTYSSTDWIDDSPTFMPLPTFNVLFSKEKR